MNCTRGQRRRHAPSVSNWRALLPVWIICGFMLALFAAVFVKQYLDGRPQPSDVLVTALGLEQNLSVPTEALSRDSIHLYSIKSAGQELRFVAQRTSDGIIHVAAATCRSCKGASQGHYAHRGVFYCGRCREAMHFDSRDTNSHGGCSMPQVPYSESGGAILIKASDVRAVFAKEFH